MICITLGSWTIIYNGIQTVNRTVTNYPGILGACLHVDEKSTSFFSTGNDAKLSVTRCAKGTYEA